MSIARMVVVLSFTLIHFSPKNFSLKEMHHNKFSSFVGGISLSYVFFHLLPTISSYEQSFVRFLGLQTSMHAYYLIFGAVLAGLVLFYLLESAYKKAEQDDKRKNPYYIDSPVFWLYMFFYFLYNAIIGTLLTVQIFKSTQSLILYLAAIGLHLFTNDWVLNVHFPHIYHKYGRPLICLAVPLGWISALVFSINPIAVMLLEAFVAGGMLLNAIQEELPQNQHSCMKSFMLGVVSYSFILLLL